MWYYLFKITISAVLVVVISEVAKRSATMGGVLASLPLVSWLAIIWLYMETQDPRQVSAFSIQVFWLVLPSLVLFVALPFFLKRYLSFFMSLLLATGLMFACYVGMWFALCSHQGGAQTFFYIPHLYFVI
jgi:hypothetical protein